MRFHWNRRSPRMRRQVLVNSGTARIYVKHASGQKYLWLGSQLRRASPQTRYLIPVASKAQFPEHGRRPWHRRKCRGLFVRAPVFTVSQGQSWAKTRNWGFQVRLSTGAPRSQAYPTSGADLTFATHPAAGSRSECQIQSSTRNLYLLVVL